MGEVTTRLLACYFQTAQPSHTWRRLSRVLASTAAMHCPGWEIRIEDASAPPGRRDRGIPSHIDNTHKLAWWAARVREAADGDQLLLIDADTAILRSLDDVWQHGFDVAYTVRSGFMTPFNAGVVFLRVSIRSRAFMERWVTLNSEIQHKSPKPWRRSHGGVNQASLALLLQETDAMGVAVKPLACKEWNCEDSAWAHFDPTVTRILHIKSELRRACLTSVIVQEPAWKPLITLWRQLETASMQHTRTA